MYKVFIENRPVIIAEKNNLPFECSLLFANKVSSIEKDVHPLIKKTLAPTPILILSSDPHKEFERLFEGYTKIDAAGGIVKKKDEYLFIKRNGKWDIPKGKLDDSESIESGAVREIEEECGIKNPKLIRLICCTYHSYKYKRKNTIKRTYWYELTYDGNEELVPQLDEGITKVKWFKENKIDKIKNNTFKSIIDVIEHYFEPKRFEGEEFDYDI